MRSGTGGPTLGLGLALALAAQPFAAAPAHAGGLGRPREPRAGAAAAPDRPAARLRGPPHHDRAVPDLEPEARGRRAVGAGLRLGPRQAPDLVRSLLLRDHGQEPAPAPGAG